MGEAAAARTWAPDQRGLARPAVSAAVAVEELAAAHWQGCRLVITVPCRRYDRGGGGGGVEEWEMRGRSDAIATG